MSFAGLGMVLELEDKLQLRVKDGKVLLGVGQVARVLYNSGWWCRDGEMPFSIVVVNTVLLC